MQKKCGDPLKPLEQAGVDDCRLSVTGYSDPVVEGTNVTLLNRVGTMTIIVVIVFGESARKKANKDRLVATNEMEHLCYTILMLAHHFIFGTAIPTSLNNCNCFIISNHVYRFYMVAQHIDRLKELRLQ